MSVVANYIHRDSPVHRLNPLTKLFWSMGIMTLSFVFRNPMVLIILFIAVLIMAYVAKILKEMIPVFKGLLFFTGFFLLFQVFLIPEGNTILVIPGTEWLRVTDQGLILSLGMGARLMVIAASFPVLLATTQVKDLVVVLVEKIKIPYTYAFMFITSLRFIPTFMNEMDQIIQAQCSRGHRLDSRNFITKFLSICPLAIPLMITSVKKAERMAISMESRGFGCGKRTYFHRIGFSRMDWVVCGVLLVVSVTGFVLNMKGIVG